MVNLWLDSQQTFDFESCLLFIFRTPLDRSLRVHSVQPSTQGPAQKDLLMIAFRHLVLERLLNYESQKKLQFFLDHTQSYP